MGVGNKLGSGITKEVSDILIPATTEFIQQGLKDNTKFTMENALDLVVKHARQETANSVVKSLGKSVGK